MFQSFHKNVGNCPDIHHFIKIDFTHYAYNIQDNKICLISSNTIHSIVETLNFTMVKKVNWSTTVPPAQVISQCEVCRFYRRLRMQTS